MFDWFTLTSSMETKDDDDYENDGENDDENDDDDDEVSNKTYRASLAPQTSVN